MMVFVEFVVLVLGIIYLFFWWKFGYWKRRNVQFIPPSFPWGNMTNPLTTRTAPGFRYQHQLDFCKSRGLKHCGGFLLWAPVYIPFDPEIINRIMVNDFEHFTGRGSYVSFKKDPLMGMILFVDGERWKRERTILTPTFTTTKMKGMLPILLKCVEQFVEALENLDFSKPIAIKDLLFCYTTDVICQCCFGFDCNSCKNPNEEIRYHGRKVAKFNRFRMILTFITFVFPNICRTLNLRVVPKDMSDFFMGTIRKAVGFRKTNNYQRNDLLQSLMKMVDEGTFDFNEMAAQAFGMYIAGFDTSATTSTFALFLLAQHEDIQEKARQNVNEIVAKYNGEITYEGLAEMTYLRQVIEETLRMYPPLPLTPRRCTKDYIEPDTGLKIDKGTLVFILIVLLHYDADYFPNPEVFDPERFSKENKPKLKPHTYLPFGDGPRSCLGTRFAFMQVGLVISNILRRYKFKLHNKTELPIRLQTFSFVLDLESDFYLSMEKITP